MTGAQGGPPRPGARSRRRSRQPVRRARSVRFGLTEEEYGEVGEAAAQAGMAKGAYAAHATLAAGPGADEPSRCAVPPGAHRADPGGRAGPADRCELEPGGCEAECHRAAVGGLAAIRRGKRAESGTAGRRGGDGAEASSVIGKVLRGQQPAGLIRYLYGPGRREEHRDPHIVAGWRHPAELEPPLRPDGHRDFRRLSGLLTQPHAALGPRGFDRPVWHCVVRAAPGDRMLSDAEWGQLAHDIMHRTGLAPHGQDDEAIRWIAVRHAADHIHVVAMLARQDGTRPQFWNDYFRVREARAAEHLRTEGRRLTRRTEAPPPGRRCWPPRISQCRCGPHFVRLVCAKQPSRPARRRGAAPGRPDREGRPGEPQSAPTAARPPQGAAASCPAHPPRGATKEIG